MNTQSHNQAWHAILEDTGTRKSYAAGEAIHYQGQIYEMIGFVVFGEAEAISFSESGDQTWVGEYGANDFIGHLSLLPAVTDNVELVAKSQTHIILISVQKFRELLNSHTALNDAFSQDFAKRLNVLTSGLIGAYALSAKGRICAELMRLSQEIGIDPGKNIIRPNPVCVDLARRVNSTRETVSRTISELQKMGVLSRQPGALIVQNPARLLAAFQ